MLSLSSRGLREEFKTSSVVVRIKNDGAEEQLLILVPNQPRVSFVQSLALHKTSTESHQHIPAHISHRDLGVPCPPPTLPSHHQPPQHHGEELELP